MAMISSMEMTEEKYQDIITEEDQKFKRLRLDFMNASESWNSEKQQFHQEILARNQRIQEIHVENIRLKAENEFKEKMIQQLMSKLSTPSGFFPPPNQYDPRLQYPPSEFK
ncbi:hypothetical protein GCK72_003954 [Caenorhabditis remanei]|uniref:Uncharacterized protein n=1 Tax=Caenorhabditis remanei TaxID=31234 RepID=A0A6A5H8E7_CAERE|nr:hypothetical protein GCK72_003954 [Caenorhabditis remanei]KAF1764008.1 hypothetical protein GCK72_003954 [Caenorhabditis remanei]